MTSKLRLSVLDQVPVRSGGSAQESIRETIELAQRADQLGYHRYWLAEHHNSSALACGSPEILLPLVGAKTLRIRVGTGGVMLPHYSPLKVAETFRLLESVFPGRIDLGIGRAPGSDPLTAATLAYGRSLDVDHYPGQVQHLIEFLAGHSLGSHPQRQVRATPDGASKPQLWLLGSGIDSAVLAGQLGCAYSHAHFINAKGTAEAIARYREKFRPGVLAEPKVNVGVSALCAETDEEADRLSLSRYLWWIRITHGLSGPFPSVEEAEDYEYQERDQAVLERLRRRSLAGNPERMRELLAGLASELDVHELVVLTITHDPEARRRSYELLSEALLREAPVTSVTISHKARYPSTSLGDGRPSNASGTQ